MVITKMTFPSKRDDTIEVHLSVLDNLRDMLNADRSSRRIKPKSRVSSGANSRFRTALLAHFDRWIKSGKPDHPCESPSYTVRPVLAENGVVMYSLDFDPPTGRPRPVTPEDLALRWFQLFQNREGRKLLSKCSKPECGQYFLRTRLPKQGTKSVLGEFCDKHKSQVRIRSTERSRFKERNRRIRRIAELAIKWERGKKAEPWKRWVVDQFNRDLDSEIERRYWAGEKDLPEFSMKQMKKAWITRYEEEIQSEIRKLRTGQR